MAKKRVKIKHIVKADSSFSDELFDMVVFGYKQVMDTVYPTVEEEKAALNLVKDSFKIELDAALCDAYKIGTKLGKKDADTADDLMYEDQPTIMTSNVSHTPADIILPIPIPEM